MRRVVATTAALLGSVVAVERRVGSNLEIGTIPPGD
jgi:hypothetical protein